MNSTTRSCLQIEGNELFWPTNKSRLLQDEMWFRVSKKVGQLLQPLERLHNYYKKILKINHSEPLLGTKISAHFIYLYLQKLRHIKSHINGEFNNCRGVFWDSEICIFNHILLTHWGWFRVPDFVRCIVGYSWLWHSWVHCIANVPTFVVTVVEFR